MEKFRERHAGVVDQVAEQGAIWLISASTFCCADEVDTGRQVCASQEVIVNIGDDPNAVRPGQGFECWEHVGVKFKTRKGIKITPDQGRLTVETKMPKGFIE